MIQFKKLIFFIFSCIAICFYFHCTHYQKSYAMKVDSYSYDNIRKQLPKKYKTEDYIYKDNNIAYIKFASNDNNAYRTSVKKSKDKNDYLYCVNYNKHILFNKTYSANNKLFNNKLRSKIGIALQYGAREWGKLANSDFTTGNSILDYYMTQCVIHSLVYKYGGNKSKYGLNYDKFTFFSDTDVLKKKTKLFYKFCCSETIIDNGQVQTTVFSFKKPSTNSLFLEKDTLVSEKIDCITNNKNAQIDNFSRQIDPMPIDSSSYSLVNDTNQYNSSFRLTVNSAMLASLKPGLHSIRVNETVKFKPIVAGFWKCSDKDFENEGQEVTGLIYDSKSLSDNITFNLLVGQVVLRKYDSISEAPIKDAAFDLLQFDDTSNQYVFYKSLAYNNSSKIYESGNIYIQSNNSKARFKIIETSAGNNHINDWEGVTFQLTKDNYFFEFSAGNTPIQGKLKLHKEGEDFCFKDNHFATNTKGNLANVKFSIYAQNDIYSKDKLLYKANEKVADIQTDKNGNAALENIPLGKYYIQESQTDHYYMLDEKKYSFEIYKNDQDVYNTVSFNFINRLKKLQIQLYKYYYKQNDSEQEKKIPLKDTSFGLYASTDIYNSAGEKVINKDTLIQEGVTDGNGELIFDNLVYGDYYLKELEAPTGFIINESIIPVTHDNFTYSKEKDIYIAPIDCMNNQQLFQLQILKTGDTLSDTITTQTEIGAYEAYKVDKKPLGKVLISLYQKDGTFIASKKTNDNGFAVFNNLEIGEYYYTEDTAPEEYIIDQEKHYINIIPDDRNKCIASSDKHEDEALGYSYQPTIDDTFNNSLFKAKLSIVKMGETVNINSDGLTYTTTCMTNIIFGLYQNFDYILPMNNKKIPRNTCVGYLTTDQNGVASFAGYLPVGEYYIKELKTNAGYELDQNLYYFNVSPGQNKDIDVALDIENNTFINYLSKASVTIYKTDSNSKKPLKNVEFTLYNEQQKKIGVYKTNKRGMILVENLPYGNYYFVETKCKKGYYSTNNKYHFSLNSSNGVTLNITNEPILQLGFNEQYKKIMITCLVVICCIIILLFLNHRRGYFSKK